MVNMKYARIKKNKLMQAFTAYCLLSHSIQEWQIIVKEFNGLATVQRNAICQEHQLLETILKEKIKNADEDMYLTCTMVNLNIIASKFDIDPATVCMCIAPLCKINEKIIIM